jgi:hypothetical protein
MFQARLSAQAGQIASWIRRWLRETVPDLLVWRDSAILRLVRFFSTDKSSPLWS